MVVFVGEVLMVVGVVLVFMVLDWGVVVICVSSVVWMFVGGVIGLIGLVSSVVVVVLFLMCVCYLGCVVSVL